MLALVGMEFAAVFNNAMMPDLVPRAELGRLSGSAWGLGYVGGLVSLVIVLGLLAGQPATGKTLLGIEPLFGLDTAAREGDRASGPLTAVWYTVFVLPHVHFHAGCANVGPRFPVLSRAGLPNSHGRCGDCRANEAISAS